jgi:hypothetical protein
MWEVFMLVSKVSCTQCIQYKSCSQKTRMFVNYCGSDRKRIEVSIKNAVLECRTRRGHLLKRGFYVDATTDPSFAEIAVSIA